MNRAAILLLLSVAAYAGPRASTTYTVVTDTADAGGRRTTSASYTSDGSIGGVEGLSTVAAPNETAKQGYIGQLYDVTGLTLTAVSLNVNEGATDQLAVWQVLDDATFLAVPPVSIAWSVPSGPIASISTGGLATAATVYHNTAAMVQGAFGGVSGMLALTVVNVNNDDFGSYAGDGLSDLWQVQSFGLNSPNAAPTADPDTDLFNNLQEFAFGTNPNSGASGPGGLVITGGLAGGTLVSAGQPITIYEATPTGYDFRAVFMRLDDYVTAGLTYIPQFSGDLITWQDSVAIPTALADDGTYQAVSVPYPFFVGGKKARFFRIQVTLAP